MLQHRRLLYHTVPIRRSISTNVGSYVKARRATFISFFSIIPPPRGSHTPNACLSSSLCFSVNSGLDCCVLILEYLVASYEYSPFVRTELGADPLRDITLTYGMDVWTKKQDSTCDDRFFLLSRPCMSCPTYALGKMSGPSWC